MKDQYVKLIKEGLKAKIDGIDGSWLKIGYGTIKGWCFSGYLEKIIYKITIPDKDIEYLSLNHDKEKTEGFHNFYSYKNEYLFQVSPLKNYIFIASINSWNHPDSEDEVNKKCWFIIYDIKNKKTVYKDTGFIIFGSLRWLENINYLLYDAGSDVPRHFIFFNLKKSKKDFNLSDVKTEFSDAKFDMAKTLYYTDDLRYFAVYYWINFSHEMPQAQHKYGVKIYDAVEEKTYIITDPDKNKNLADHIKDKKK